MVRKGPSPVTLSQERAPLFEALLQYVQTVKAPLHVPGHKMGRAAPPLWREFLGERALSIDLTEAPGLDDLHAPEGAIAEAQELAAQAFGAAASFFLVGGTTAGLHALVLAACRPGDTIAVPRHAHRSVAGALILSGAKPAWIRTRFHPELDLAEGIHEASLTEALQTSSALVLVHPTYFGHVDRLAMAVQQAHASEIPVLVDEAHGTHFAFHPDLPPPALATGADGVVQSVHKTGGSLTQSSLCHLGADHRLDRPRLAEMLRLVQSTSPSYLLMASLDLARRELYHSGYAAWDRVLDLAVGTRKRLCALRGIRVHPSADPTKIVIDVRGRGITGVQAAQSLWSEGVAVESSGLGFVLAVLSPGDSIETVDYLVGATNRLPHGPGVPPPPPEPPWPETVLIPREAALGRKRLVPLGDAVGLIAAETVAPYPPGIPVVTPGERLTPEVISYLQHVSQAGYRLQGPADPTLSAIQVVEE